MFRYAVIIVGILVLVGYVLFLAARGSISGRFRTISLTLLALFLLLAGFGLYTTKTKYQVQTVQEQYTTNKKDILESISSLYTDQKFTQARKKAEEYMQVNDPRLDRWYRRAREAELLQQEEALPDTAFAQRLSLWEELAELTQRDQYAKRAEEVRQVWYQAQEKDLVHQIKSLPAQALAQRALGYELLTRLNPDRPLYKQQYRSYLQRIESRIHDSPWTNLCDSRRVEYCDQVGYALKSILTEASSIHADSAEVYGVSWRPKGTQISQSGRVAPEDGTYYLVHDWTSKRLLLINVAYVHLRHPFPQIAQTTKGESL